MINEELNGIIKNQKKQLETINSKNIIEKVNDIEILNLNDNCKKDKIINNNKSLLSNKFAEDENLIQVIFISDDESIVFPVLCKRKEKFYNLENSLYNSFPEFNEVENDFYLNGKKIKRRKSLKSNGINNNSIIFFKQINED